MDCERGDDGQFPEMAFIALICSSHFHHFGYHWGFEASSEMNLTRLSAYVLRNEW